MDTLTAIRERRSVKHFDPEHRMSDGEIRRLLEHALLSPTSFNIQNWRFIAVTDQEKKDALCATSWGQKQVREASLTLLLCADLRAHEGGERYWREAPDAVQKAVVPAIASLYENDAQLRRDEAMRSIGIAGQSIMLAAKAMGYDSCPMIGFDQKQAAEIIKLPPEHIIGMMITIGKAVKPAGPRGGQLPYEEIVFYNTFP